MPGTSFRACMLAVLTGLLFVAACAGSSLADTADATPPTHGLAPAPMKGKGDSCVADTDFMRRYHMSVLGHQRDDTVHEGIRTKKFSLKECVDCHAVAGEDAKPVTIESPKHFCRTCHDYAAVKIDCFQCHASRPEPGKAAGLPAGDDDKIADALSAYLMGQGR